VHDVLCERSQPHKASERVALLQEIPFRAVLTTNIDPILQGSSLDPGLYASVLREDHTWWGRSDWTSPTSPDRTPIVKLHGHADGQDGRPVVLARTDYRRRIYEDHGYPNFLRCVFARYTLLFLGVSFTDAYLNELRSEVLSFIRKPGDEDPPWGYAVMGRPHDAKGWRQFMRAHEGIEVLLYPSGQDHTGFDRWLRAIADCTSVTRRLDHLLAQQSVVWIDPDQGDNSHGIRILEGEGRGGCRRRVELLQRPDQLRDEHAQAALLITRFGHREGGADAFDVLDRLRSWPERPPVVIFANENEHVAHNRLEVLRRGAWEYATGWPELFEAIERLFGRRTRPQNSAG
jgi:hypothetical protein